MKGKSGYSYYVIAGSRMYHFYFNNYHSPIRNYGRKE